MVRQTAGLGIALTILVIAVAAAIGGSRAGFAAGVFGGLATVLQVAAVRLVTRPIDRDWYPAFLRRWGTGMAIRLVGVVAIPIAVGAARDQFPPLPSALGYVSVVVPLLFFETRLFR